MRRALPAQLGRAIRTLIIVALLTIAVGCSSLEESGGQGNQPAPTAFVMTAAPEISSTANESPEPQIAPAASIEIQEYPLPLGSRPHDVAPAPDGTVWYTAQRAEALGSLNPENGETVHIPLGEGSAPHGVIVGPQGDAWVTDSGLNAIVRVDDTSHAVTVFPLPSGGNANLNTAVFDPEGVLWFTGQNGVYGWLDPASGDMQVFEAPRGRGPYGIASDTIGTVYYASLAGSYVGRIGAGGSQTAVLDPPTSGQGARRVWADSSDRVWVSEWNAGQLGVYDPAANQWREWAMPGENPMPYAIYVDERDLIWLSDFGSNSIVRFDPATELFDTFILPSAGANVRQILGRPGEIWGAESGTDKLVVLRYP